MPISKITLQLQFHIYNNSWNIFTKTIHYVINVTFTETELFLIRCGINQAVQILNAKYIIIIKDTIPAARCICYNLKLGSGYNLGKTWVEKRRYDQLVKYKNTG